ncbi:hypothetical protein PFISCL1PPCAC_8509, partial [Pristionchus fissidentatus]
LPDHAPEVLDRGDDWTLSADVLALVVDRDPVGVNVVALSFGPFQHDARLVDAEDVLVAVLGSVRVERHLGSTSNGLRLALDVVELLEQALDAGGAGCAHKLLVRVLRRGAAVLGRTRRHLAVVDGSLLFRLPLLHLRPLCHLCAVVVDLGVFRVGSSFLAALLFRRPLWRRGSDHLLDEGDVKEGLGESTGDHLWRAH